MQSKYKISCWLAIFILIIVTIQFASMLGFFLFLIEFGDKSPYMEYQMQVQWFLSSIVDFMVIYLPIKLVVDITAKFVLPKD